MDLSNFPPDSYEKLRPGREFPQRIKYLEDTRKECHHVWREYSECGCYKYWYQRNASTCWDDGPTTNYVQCTLHDGNAFCLLSQKGINAEISRMIDTADKHLQEAQFRVNFYTSQKKRWEGKGRDFAALQHVAQTLKRDASPTRE